MNVTATASSYALRQFIVIITEDQMYAPTNDLYDGIAKAFPLQLFPWDEYFERMAEADFLLGRFDMPAAKSYFVRNAPFDGSHIVLGGITSFLRQLNELRFDDPDFVAGMLDRGLDPTFVEFLKNRKKFKKITVHAPPEGTVFFPNEPIITFVGSIGELRLADGMLIEEVNYPSLSITKWARMNHVVRPGAVTDFSRRRSQNSLKTSLYATVGGCIATSNCELARSFKVVTKGTMGHEWIESFPTLREAYDAWLSIHPDLPLALVDTIRCLEVDFPEWLDAVYRHRDKIKAANPATWGWRNDSGDLAYLTLEQYIMFLKHPLAQDPWFVESMRVTLTNDLDEYSATAIIGQIATQGRAAGIDANNLIARIFWAAGTRPGVCYDNPALGGVMKLQESDGKATIKLALDADGRVGVKTSIPGFNLSAFIHDGVNNVGILIYNAKRYHIDKDGHLFDDFSNHKVKKLEACHPDNATLLHELEKYKLEPRQQIVFDGGLTDFWQQNRPTIESVQQRVRKEIERLPWYYTRIDKPHIFPVSVTPNLYRMRQHMIKGGHLQMEYPAY
jgi:nicotinate phosphoribosyltransferase